MPVGRLVASARARDAVRTLHRRGARGMLSARCIAQEAVMIRQPLTATAFRHDRVKADLHRRQRARVAASLLAVPGASRPTHRRWAV
jgi:hypothetical protein